MRKYPAPSRNYSHTMPCTQIKIPTECAQYSWETRRRAGVSQEGNAVTKNISCCHHYPSLWSQKPYSPLTSWMSVTSQNEWGPQTAIRNRIELGNNNTYGDSLESQQLPMSSQSSRERDKLKDPSEWLLSINAVETTCKCPHSEGLDVYGTKQRSGESTVVSVSVHEPKWAQLDHPLWQASTVVFVEETLRWSSTPHTQIQWL